MEETGRTVVYRLLGVEDTDDPFTVLAVIEEQDCSDDCSSRLHVVAVDLRDVVDDEQSEEQFKARVLEKAVEELEQRGVKRKSRRG